MLVVNVVVVTKTVTSGCWGFLERRSFLVVRRGFLVVRDNTCFLVVAGAGGFLVVTDLVVGISVVAIVVDLGLGFFVRVVICSVVASFVVGTNGVVLFGFRVRFGVFTVGDSVVVAVVSFVVGGNGVVRFGFRVRCFIVEVTGNFDAVVVVVGGFTVVTLGFGEVEGTTNGEEGFEDVEGRIFEVVTAGADVSTSDETAKQK